MKYEVCGTYPGAIPWEIDTDETTDELRRRLEESGDCEYTVTLRLERDQKGKALSLASDVGLEVQFTERARTLADVGAVAWTGQLERGTIRTRLLEGKGNLMYVAIEEVLRAIISGLILCCCLFVGNLVIHVFCGGKDQ